MAVKSFSKSRKYHARAAIKFAEKNFENGQKMSAKMFITKNPHTIHA